MEFLPIRIEGKRVYAGVWRRFYAGLVNVMLILPISYLFNSFVTFNIIMAITITITYKILFSLFHVYLDARFGGNLGKLAVGIRITKPDGSRIGWIEAWKRCSVNLVFSFFLIIAQVWALLLVDYSDYASQGFSDRSILLEGYYPAWYIIWQILGYIWIWSEAFVCISNRRRRAIHDYIAGTVVVYKRFQRQSVAEDNSDINNQGDIIKSNPLTTEC